MERLDLKLLTIINNLVEDLSEPSVHYLIQAMYFLYYDQKINFAPMHFNRDSAHDVKILEDEGRISFAY